MVFKLICFLWDYNHLYLRFQKIFIFAFVYLSEVALDTYLGETL